MTVRRSPAASPIVFEFVHTVLLQARAGLFTNKFENRQLPHSNTAPFRSWSVNIRFFSQGADFDGLVESSHVLQCCIKLFGGDYGIRTASRGLQASPGGYTTDPR